MDGPLPPSPGQAQGLEVFGVPAFHPAVSSTLPLAGDGCLHMEPQRDTDWDSGEQHPAMWTEVTARTFSRTPRGTFYYLKWPRSSQGCSRGSASRSRVCLRLPCGSSSAQRPGLWASLGDHTPTGPGEGQWLGVVWGSPAHVSGGCSAAPPPERGSRCPGMYRCCVCG